jgi:hypothetical protein
MDKANFLFSGDLITGKEAYSWLKDSLPLAHNMSSLASCYMKEEALRQLLSGSTVKGRLLARWRPGDLIQGSSDLGAYQVARDKGWEFYISQNFHGKVYRLPGIGTLVGSANATLSGLSIFGTGNDEVSTIVSNTDRNELVVEDIFNNATLLTPNLFAKISQVVSKAKIDILDKKGSDLIEWPLEISEALNAPNQKGLFVSDCFESPWSASPSQADLSLLGLRVISLSDELISSSLGHTKIYHWLVNSCRDAGGVVRYGELTQKLHSYLLDDPLPYRSSVKVLLSNLLSWVEHFKKDEIRISTPNHAQVIELL